MEVKFVEHLGERYMCERTPIGWRVRRDGGSQHNLSVNGGVCSCHVSKSGHRECKHMAALKKVLTAQ